MVTITCDTAAITEQVAGATFAPGNYARLTLAIPGRAMDPEKRKVIFESFLHKQTGKSQARRWLAHMPWCESGAGT